MQKARHSYRAPCHRQKNDRIIPASSVGLPEISNSFSALDVQHRTSACSAAGSTAQAQQKIKPVPEEAALSACSTTASSATTTTTTTTSLFSACKSWADYADEDDDDFYAHVPPLPPLNPITPPATSKPSLNRPSYNHCRTSINMCVHDHLIEEITGHHHDAEEEEDVEDEEVHGIRKPENSANNYKAPGLRSDNNGGAADEAQLYTDDHSAHCNTDSNNAVQKKQVKKNTARRQRRKLRQEEVDELDAALADLGINPEQNINEASTCGHNNTQVLQHSRAATSTSASKGGGIDNSIGKGQKQLYNWGSQSIISNKDNKATVNYRAEPTRWTKRSLHAKSISADEELSATAVLKALQAAETSTRTSSWVKSSVYKQQYRSRR